MPRKPQVHGHDTRYVKMQKNNCFVCGMNNPDGMRLKFQLDEERQTFVCKFRLGKRYTGPPGHCHGGIIASILDDAMGKVNKLHHVVALTKEMTVEYLKPVPLHKPLHVEGREVSVERPRSHQHRRNPERKERSPGPQQGHLHRHRPRKNVRQIRGKIAISSQPSAFSKIKAGAPSFFRGVCERAVGILTLSFLRG